MARKTYDSYEYIDPDNQYTYSNSSVLINKQGIQDAEKAELNKARYSQDRLFDLRLKPILVHSMSDVLKIHGYIFQDVYQWAGQYRKVNISKNRHPFMALQAFGEAEQYMNSLINNFHQCRNEKSEIAKQLAIILDNESYLHPFREGNGRTQREVIRALAFEKGWQAQIRSEESDEIYNLYMDGTEQFMKM